MNTFHAFAPGFIPDNASEWASSGDRFDEMAGRYGPGGMHRDRRDVFRYEGYFEGGTWHPNENLPAEPATAPKPTELAPELAAVVPSRYVAIEDHPSGAYMGKVLGSNSRNASLDRAITSHDYKTDKAFTLYEAVAHVSAKPAPVPQPERVVVRAG